MCYALLLFPSASVRARHVPLAYSTLSDMSKRVCA